MLEAWVLRIPEYAERLMTKLWPGALTLALPAKPHVSKRLTAEGGSIGVRISSHATAQRLVTRLGRAVTATSANPGGLPAPYEIAAAEGYFGTSVDAYLDGGRLHGGPGSTVVDASGDRPLLVREGAIPAEAIEQAAAMRLER
jgi:L-threonylcarbamoyladenylate synthase